MYRKKTLKIERNRKVEKAARLKESWALQRECTRILSENHTSWLERRKEELERRNSKLDDKSELEEEEAEKAEERLSLFDKYHILCIIGTHCVSYCTLDA